MAQHIANLVFSQAGRAISAAHTLSEIRAGELPSVGDRRHQNF